MSDTSYGFDLPVDEEMELMQRGAIVFANAVAQALEGRPARTWTSSEVAQFIRQVADLDGAS